MARTRTAIYCRISLDRNGEGLGVDYLPLPGERTSSVAEDLAASHMTLLILQNRRDRDDKETEHHLRNMLGLRPHHN